MLLTRDEILKAEDIQYETVPVPEWAPGGTVRVKTLSGEERDDWEQMIQRDREAGGNVTIRNIRARLVVLACVNDKGLPIFTPGDVERLGKKSAKPLGRIYTRVAEMSGLTNQDVEELAGNSAGGASEDSGSSSASPSGSPPSKRPSDASAPGSSPSGELTTA